jgi:hypothetical protein
MSHDIWRRVRRPFRYPSCRACVWEVYDANQAGCLKCGKMHRCDTNAVDNRCPLVTCDDLSRVCEITGMVLPEVRHARDEFMDHVVFDEKAVQSTDTEEVVHGMVSRLLLSRKAQQCREKENAKQYARLNQHLYKQMKCFKLTHPERAPNICHILAAAIAQEKMWRFISSASEPLAQACSRHITRCIVELRAKGSKISIGQRVQDLVCGLLYMLKHGLNYQDRVLLPMISEVERCLPHENKIESYFGISSKVICMTENEVKLVFRECYQR